MIRRLIGSSNFFGCPGCRAVLQKSNLLRGALGTIRCGGCGRAISVSEIDEGRYDLEEVELTCPSCATHLRGPGIDLLGQPCPACDKPLPRA